jgi:hypothetical protein
MAKAELKVQEPMTMKTLEQFRADAARLYERCRDESKTIAVLELASALVTAYGEGTNQAFEARLREQEPASREVEPGR